MKLFIYLFIIFSLEIMPDEKKDLVSLFHCCNSSIYYSD